MKIQKTIKFDSKNLIIVVDKIQCISIDNSIINITLHGDNVCVECKDNDSAKEVVDKIIEFLHNENSNKNQTEYGIVFGYI